MNQGFVEQAQNCLYAACKGVVYVIVSYTKVVALEHSADKTQEGYHKLKTESGASSTPLEGFGEPGVLRSQSQWCFVACSVHEVCLRGVWVTGYCGPMGYVHKIPAHRAGGRIRLWGIRGYGVSGVWDTRGSTVSVIQVVRRSYLPSTNAISSPRKTKSNQNTVSLKNASRESLSRKKRGDHAWLAPSRPAMRFCNIRRWLGLLQPSSPHVPRSASGTADSDSRPPVHAACATRDTSPVTGSVTDMCVVTLLRVVVVVIVVDVTVADSAGDTSPGIGRAKRRSAEVTELECASDLRLARVNTRECPEAEIETGSEPAALSAECGLSDPCSEVVGSRGWI
ncbi:hypothetical protein EDB85DRAFT_2277822 [Lactarius pseudohatsudake]|nr:hypothetical protein EDB85DRAFT_2277822 [Lactarius pseudohatsudake]